MSTITERITKLATKLETIDTKITSLTNEREAIAGEISSLVTGITTGYKATNATNDKPVKKVAGSLGAAIMNHLSAVNGADLSVLAKAVKSSTHQTGLALYHLTKKGLAFQNGGLYFKNSTAENTMVAATLAPAVANDGAY